jgi:hypothetical protein
MIIDFVECESCSESSVSHSATGISPYEALFGRKLTVNLENEYMFLNQIYRGRKLNLILLKQFY